MYDPDDLSRHQSQVRHSPCTLERRLNTRETVIWLRNIAMKKLIHASHTHTHVRPAISQSYDTLATLAN